MHFNQYTFIQSIEQSRTTVTEQQDTTVTETTTAIKTSDTCEVHLFFIKNYQFQNRTD